MSMNKQQARLDVYLYMSGATKQMGTFVYRLLHAWAHADGENQARLAQGFPELAAAIDEYVNEYDEHYEGIEWHFSERGSV